MPDADIDEVDRAIVHALQEDARNLSSEEIAERVGIAGSTVRKRVGKLETAGVIKGYSAEVDYQRSGYPLRMLLFCTASIPERGELVSDVLAIDGVVAVQELVTGEQNLLVTAVGESDDDITPIAQALLEMGLTVTDEVLVRSHETTPFGDRPVDGWSRASRPTDEIRCACSVSGTEVRGVLRVLSWWRPRRLRL
jgi:DNA-binding Lrp family transcriptional regulator